MKDKLIVDEGFMDVINTSLIKDAKVLNEIKELLAENDRILKERCGFPGLLHIKTIQKIYMLIKKEYDLPC